MNPICTCKVCYDNLIKPNNGRLQVWYGTGGNGKTTLLNEVIRKVEENGKKVQYLTTKMFSNPDYDVAMIENNIGLYLIRDPENKNEMNKILSYFEQHGNKFVRHIMMTNVKPKPYFGKNDVIEFTHIFN